MTVDSKAWTIAEAADANASVAKSAGASSLLPLFLLIVLAAFLRLATLDTPSVWIDEFATMWFQDKGLQFLWTDLPHIETHPPLYYAILSVLLPEGPSPFALRLPGAVFGVLTVPVAYLMTLRLGLPLRQRRAAALLAAAACATHPFLVDMQQMARMYGTLTFAYAIILLCVIALNDHAFSQQRAPSPRNTSALAASGWPWAVGLGVSAAAAQYLQSTGAIFVISACLPLAVRGLIAVIRNAEPDEASQGRAALGFLVVSAITAAVMYAPYFPSFVQQARGLTPDFWIPPANVELLALIGLKMAGAPRLTGDLTSASALFFVSGGAIVLVATAYGVLRMLLATKTPNAASNSAKPAQNEAFVAANLQWGLITLIVAAVLPVLFFLTLDLFGRHLLLPRTISPIAMPACVLIGAAFSVYFSSARHRLAIGLFALWFASASIHHSITREPNEDIRGMVRDMTALSETTTVDTLVTASGLLDYAMAYYAQRNNWTVNVATSAPAYEDNAALSESGIGGHQVMSDTEARTIANATENSKCFLYIIRGEETRDPNGVLFKAFGSDVTWSKPNVAAPPSYTVYLAERGADACRG